MTLLDYPGRVACTVFTYGCDFRCPFCHNASLVEGQEPAQIDEESFFSFLKSRRGILDGVAITGGEPTMAEGLFDFMKRVRDLGFLIKLDSNGSFPDRLEAVIDAGLVDYIAMDVKSSRENYAKVAGVPVDIAKIERSITLLKTSGVAHEFRTTVVKGLHTVEDIAAIAAWMGPDEPYFLQGFVDSGDILTQGCDAFGKEEMHEMLRAARKFNPLCQLRGID